MKIYTFVWSPEGRPINSYLAWNYRVARALFRREYQKTYARFMGEVYVIETNE